MAVNGEDSALLRVHRFEPLSLVNGPGRRAVLWSQGCPLACPGCFNPETHSMTGGERWSVEVAAEKILALTDSIEGITLSGGEPLLQHAALAKLLRIVRAQSSLSVLVFSGYTLEEHRLFPRIEAFLSQVDVLIAGRYEQGQRVADGLIGSANKQVHFLTGRYSPADLEQVPQAEVIIGKDGEITLSGIDPLQWI